MTTELDYVIKNRQMTLPVALDNLEIAQLARDAAKEDAKLVELEVKAADAKAEWKEKIEMQERIIATMREDIAREKQDRVILVDEIFQNGKIVSIRQDNGVVVATRAASPQESQKHLPAMEGSGGGILDAARKAQQDNGVEEDDEGDVVSPEGDGKPKKRAKK